MRSLIMSVDAGKTSGVCFQILRPGKRPVMKQTILHHPCHAGQSHPLANYARAAIELCLMWERYRTYALQRYRIPPDRHYLVLEDYMLNLGQTGDTSRDRLAPVYINSMIVGFREGRGYTYNYAASAPADTRLPLLSPPSDKSMVKDNQLRAAGLWVPGKPHGMDALRHAILVGKKLGYVGLLAKRDYQPGPVIRED